MAILRVSSYVTADTSVADIFTFANGPVTNATATSYTLTSTDGTASFYITGTGFTYSGGRPVSGTNTGITEHLNTYGFDAYSIASESTDVLTVQSIVATGDAAALNAYTFRADDQLFGSPNADNLLSYDGNDILTGGGGNDTIDGGSGTDTAAYSGPRSAYTITQLSSGGLSVTDTRSGSPDGTDSLKNVERLQFSDGVIGVTPPTLGAVQATAAAPVAGGVVLQSGINVIDPDTAASATSARAAITSGFVSGDLLTAGSLPAGVTASFDASSGVLTLTGAASDVDYQAALRSISFVHNGSASAGSRVVSFTLTDDQGLVSSPATETVTVATLSSPPVLSVSALTSGFGAGPGGVGQVLVYTFDVKRSGDVTGTSTAHYTVIPSGAHPATAADFGGAFPQGDVVILPGQADGVVNVTFAGANYTSDTFTVVLSFPQNGVLGGTSASIGSGSPVGSFTPPSAPVQSPSQQAGYSTQTDNLIRVSSNDPALTDTTSPLYAQIQAEKAIAARLDAGQISAADAQSALFHLLDGTTSVAEMTYSFFTGKTPTGAGLDYLVHSSANLADLNDAYYQGFTVENRYINFSVNLATGSGAGATAFQANYGSLSLQDATAKAYQAVFGITPTADKVSAILNEQVTNGLGGTETRAQYLADVSGGSDIAQKAAVAGFLLADSVKEGFGTYQQADLHFLQDLAHGTAAFNVDLLAAYSQAPNLVGQPVVDPTLGG